MPLAPRAAGPRRLLALLLLAVFLGAGTTVPGPDALLYHWHADGGEPTRAHIEAAGGCASHLESCTLGRAAAGTSAAVAADPGILSHPDAVDRSGQHPAGTLPTTLRGTLPQPRAPPAAVA